MKEIRSSEAIKAELNQSKIVWKGKKKQREELAKQLEALDTEIAELLQVTWGNDRRGKIADLEQELHTASIREHKEALPKAVINSKKGEKAIDYRIEKVTPKRIYLTTLGGNNFHVSRDGSDGWSKQWGLNIPATIAAWEKFQVNYSATRKK